MRIGILTHPLTFNYGGILQCYAMSMFLQKLGHTSIVIRREHNTSSYKRTIRCILQLLHIKPYYNQAEEQKVRNIKPFVNNHFNRTHAIYSDKEIKKVCRMYHLDAVLVGSDQVWRKDFAMHYGFNYFLDFVPNDIIKFSYAASFGLSEWQYDSKQTERIRTLLGLFSGITVREVDAVSLCREYLDIEPELKIDPTLLLNSFDYDRISSPRLLNKPYVFFYWLGDEDLINEDIQRYQNQGISVKCISLRQNTPLPKIEDWLSYIKNADIVITDSFHGCVFSILFHKKLEVRYHKSYGRIQSLMSLMERTEKEFKSMTEIQYNKIDDIIEKQRRESRDYLNNVLSNKIK